MIGVPEVSGLIAAAVVLVEYVLPAAIVVIVAKYVENENNATTWSVLNRTISTTLWPHFLQADSVSIRHGSKLIEILSWTSTISAAILVVPGVLAPVGLREVVVPADLAAVEFQYVHDGGPWGRVTMSRPDRKFSRYCEYGRNLACPGQYQGVYMDETSPGILESVLEDENSTIKTTIPRNYTSMFSSATSDMGNTLSGLFDIQYRRWKINQAEIIDKGESYVAGEIRSIETLIIEDAIVLREGLVINMGDRPGIGFRNHIGPVGLRHGGTWTEDLTWVEPITQCADTNLSVEVQVENTGATNGTDYKFFVFDRGAFVGIDTVALETRPWLDNQTLDLHGRSHKAARMYNVLAAMQLNVSLPVPADGKTVGKVAVPKLSTGEWWDDALFNEVSIDEISLDKLRSFRPLMEDGDSHPITNISNFVDYYPDGRVKLLALNHTAIRDICRGYYRLGKTFDARGNNITYPAVDCGLLVGSGHQTAGDETSQKKTLQKDIYVCATGVRASVKSVNFRYNGTDGRLTNLETLRVRDKDYADDDSKPLWAVEHSYDRRMYFSPLWGVVNDSYETTEGFYTLRDEGLWLPASPLMDYIMGVESGPDALAATSAFISHLGGLYNPWYERRDYSGRFEFALLERFQRLLANESTASSIPSLILTDGLAANLVGTKTSMSPGKVGWPASLAVDDPKRGIPRVKVMRYDKVIRYDMRYAIPGLLVLFVLVSSLLLASVILFTSPSLVKRMRHMYDQTSTGRLAAGILSPEKFDPRQKSTEWVRGCGQLLLRFGQFDQGEEGPFCEIVSGIEVTESTGSEADSDTPATTMDSGPDEHDNTRPNTSDGNENESRAPQGTARAMPDDVHYPRPEEGPERPANSVSRENTGE